ncbi:DUF4167 domain-containing protein [Chelativorans alearense]|uniref:DUF4167 domain-containing protein n=1 Tax=Chelativorans alearense TaxID=2681495 RepID=UPI0013D4EBE0|nr:DUF4167 domain-containing protein [Chelativorans alearense]
MRPQQQNRRMRGRGNNNNRKGPNPLTRSYESNGPDVKIRGTAQQVADKYTTLARDAQSSGDRVMAENYLQHAEHYNRLIAAAQAQLQPQQNTRDYRDDDDDREDRDEQEHSRSEAQPRQRQRVEDGYGPQPVIDGIPAEVALDRQNAGTSNTGTNGAKSNGHADASGEDAAPKQTEAAGDEAAEAPKPAKRPRRPRKKASDTPTAEAGESQPADEATAEG